MATESRGRLSVVATPIGNLEDITLRALRTLREADAILAEDTRRTRKLCTHHAIHTPVRSFHAYSKPAVLERVLSELAGGSHLALVSDAGTPLISDPGIELVSEASKRGARVEAIPGPSALTAALSVCGLGCDDVRFVGFLPRSGARRRAWLEAMARETSTLVLFEAPARLSKTLADVAAHTNQRRVAVCRELTKAHEEVLRGSATELIARVGAGVRGEITIVIEGAQPDADKWPEDVVDARIAEQLREGKSARDIARELAPESGHPRNELYRRITALKEGRNGDG